MIKSWRYWNEFVFRLPLNIGLFVRCHLKGLKPSELVKANPDLKYGGISFASKYDLNNQFNPKYMLGMTLITTKQKPSERYKTLESFFEKEKTSFPVALKPDIGHSGKGVSIIKTEKEAKKFLKKIQTNYIAQVYCDYPFEYGVFYINKGGEAKIYSMNEKIFPRVTGDGKKSIKELMKNDRVLYQFIANYNPEELSKVPGEGETRIISSLGNIHQGGIYKDISHLKTSELLIAIQEAIGSVDFNYGRFDVKAESTEDLLAGKFKIIEVNGVHASSSNFFDEQYNYIQAAKIIKEQYRHMLDIALENQHKDVPTLTLWEAIKMNKEAEQVLDHHQDVAVGYR